ncbi:translation initiation factor eIF 4e-like domain-containing protein [Tricharina praecox]|uniref:translation initiation factor eIF 4e-like domain-containing protein n=1 Tax=Tricharina praecox TaxID=43433 RepID=UPI00221EA27E|nr:translation initiation factor eIF 4e-like domain-containing protein [Tricharina praecox]KAI5854583.1 translation initiation factor eIF 4e-like domain-containing protein [Tricharina praecox]
MAETTTTPVAPIDDANAGKRAELRMTMLKKLRPYPLRHEWVFWHEKDDPDASPEKWDDRLKEIAQISTVQSFWQVFNNTPFTNLTLKESLHLFKKNVKPLWEDPRNKNGGAWTFRVPKAQSHEFWKEVLMMAIGEILQEVVEKGDDICGVSISVRFNSHLILVWTRDAENEKSRDAILAKVMESLPEEMRPQPSSPYYKKHNDHKNYTPAAK